MLRQERAISEFFRVQVANLPHDLLQFLVCSHYLAKLVAAQNSYCKLFLALGETEIAGLAEASRLGRTFQVEALVLELSHAYYEVHAARRLRSVCFLVTFGDLGFLNFLLNFTAILTECCEVFVLQIDICELNFLLLVVGLAR